MQYDFRIGGVQLRLYADEPLIFDWQSDKFLTESSNPELTVWVHMIQELPQPAGRQVDTSWETRLYLDRQTFWLETYDRKDGAPMIRSRFTAGDSNVHLWARRDYMPHTTRSWVLWSAMDLPWLLLSRGVLTLHSASVMHQGGVILFSAPSQTGKSTQARLWEQFRGAKQLNGDKNCIAFRDGKVLAMGTPFSGTSGICTSYEAPLRAIVLLQQAPVNEVVRLTGIRAVVAVLENCFSHREVPGAIDRVTAILAQVLNEVPVYCLSCTPDENAVKALEAVLQKED